MLVGCYKFVRSEWWSFRCGFSIDPPNIIVGGIKKEASLDVGVEYFLRQTSGILLYSVLQTKPLDKMGYKELLYLTYLLYFDCDVINDLVMADERRIVRPIVTKEEEVKSSAFSFPFSEDVST